MQVKAEMSWQSCRQGAFLKYNNNQKTHHVDFTAFPNKDPKDFLDVNKLCPTNPEWKLAYPYVHVETEVARSELQSIITELGARRTSRHFQVDKGFTLKMNVL